MYPFNLKKFIHAVIFFHKYTNPKILGKVKLMKLFYFAEFRHMKKYGRPLIGDIYRKDELGPVAKHAESIINYIAHGINSKDFSGIEKEAGIVKEAVDIKVKANRRLEFNPRVEFERKYFSKSDIEILSEVSREFAKDNSKIISDKSHNEQGWLNTRHKDIIDWMYAFPEEDRAEIKQYLDHSNNLISSFNKMIDSCQ